MWKKAFLFFILCGAVIIAIGVYFLLTNKTAEFRIDDPFEYVFYGGKEIIIIGTIMILVGLFLKLKSSNKKDAES